jgi:putative ABC transport system permease protein
MGVVGGVGLFSTMSVQVLERRREFGVLRAVGGTSRMVIAGVLVEGIVVGIASGALALGASFPLSALLGAFVGTVAAGVPFTALPSVGAMAACLAVVTLGAALASAPAALHVARVPLRQLLEG